MRYLAGAVFMLFSTVSYAQTCGTLVAPASTTLSFTGPGYWRYMISSGFIAGAPAIDELDAEFYSNAVGSFSLATGANNNYATCNQCVSFSRDYTDPVQTKFFFQSGGLLTLSLAPGTNPLAITLSNTRLVEVTLDPTTFFSTPVPGGECYDLVTDQIFRSGFDG
jgi:hypothetical protein